jgi:hypothetical protein
VKTISDASIFPGAGTIVTPSARFRNAPGQPQAFWPIDWSD